MATTQGQREFVSSVDNPLLGRAVYCLDDRYRKVFAQRLIRHNPKTLQQLSDELGISKQRVRQIQILGFEKVHNFIDGAAKLSKT